MTTIIKVKSANLLRKDTAENWTNKNPVLRQGEEGYETDTGRRKVGDGTTAWNELFYTVDQSYAPESLKAQSGKAVAEAVLPKLDKPENAPQIGDTLKVTSVNTDGTFACKWAEVGNGSESVGKCIGKITLEENARIVEFTQCQDGSPLNFSEVIITISGSSDSSGRNICFDVNHTRNAEAYSWTMTTGAQLSTDSRYVTVHAKIIGGWMLLGTTQSANIYNTSVNNGHNYISAAANKNEKITESIVIGIGWGYMAAGTIIKVWGR